MSVIIKIPTFLGLHPDLCGAETNYRMIDVSGSTISEALDQMEARFPGIKKELCDKEGKLKMYWDIFVNSENIFPDYPDTLDRPLMDGDVITIALIPMDG